MKHDAVIRQHLDLLKRPEAFDAVSVPQWRNGLAVRMPNHLGDAVMALPALAALHSALPENCGLFVITPASNAQLYRALPFVDTVIALEKPHKFWSNKERLQVKRLRPGAAVLFNHSLRDAVCLKLAGVPYLYGEPTRNRGLLLAGKFRNSFFKKPEVHKRIQPFRGKENSPFPFGKF